MILFKKPAKSQSHSSCGQSISQQSPLKGKSD
jgi:hypothetical protein